jgi:branched-chain amino acid transport system substrate-binding protein
MKKKGEKERISRRKFMKMAGSVAAGIAVSRSPFLLSDAKANQIFKLGFIAPLTGPFAVEAEDMKTGVIMAVDEWNAKGGVLGRKVELIVRDDQLNPAEGARKAKEIVEQEQVKYIAGSLSSAVQMTINNYTKKVGVMFVSLSCSDEITKMPDFSKYTFHDYATSYMHNEAVGNYAFDHKLGKKFYILLADYAFGHQGLENISKVIKDRGGEIIGTARHPLGTTDYSMYMPKILDAKPDILYVVSFGKDQVNTLKNAYSYGIQKRMSIMTAISIETIAKEVGAQAFQGVLASTIFYWEMEDTNPQAKRFVQEFRKRKGRPPTFEAATGYSGVMEILDGVRRAGTDDVEQVIKVLEGHEYNHYKGPQKWRKCDHQSIQDMYVIMGKGPSEITREWDLFKIVGKRGGEGILKPCEELGHK